MNRVLCVLLLLSSGPAAAAVAIYPLGIATNELKFVNLDGYHFVSYRGDGARGAWFVDGRRLSTDALGETDSERVKLAAALSADGKTFAYLQRVQRQDGSAGVAVVTNGRRGPVHDAVMDLRVSPSGKNVVYFAKENGQGCRVMATIGIGPFFEECPYDLSISDKGMMYLATWKDTTVIYRDVGPLATGDFRSLIASPNLTHHAVRLDDGHANYFQMDDKKIAMPVIPPWTLGDDAVLTDDGHYAFTSRRAASGPMDTVVVDGAARAAPGEPRHLAMRPGTAEAFWLSAQGAVVGGRALALRWTDSTDGRRWIGFSPSGRHYAFVSRSGNKSVIVVDGKPVKEQVPLEVPFGAVAFDGESEFHYVADVGGKVALVCVTLNQTAAQRTNCAHRAGALPH